MVQTMIMKALSILIAGGIGFWVGGLVKAIISFIPILNIVTGWSFLGIPFVEGVFAILFILGLFKVFPIARIF